MGIPLGKIGKNKKFAIPVMIVVSAIFIGTLIVLSMNKDKPVVPQIQSQPTNTLNQ